MAQSPAEIAYFTTYGGNLALTVFSLSATTPNYLALHTSDPTPLGNSGTELSGAGYLRAAIYFNPPSAKAVLSANTQLYSALPSATVTHLAVWTSRAGGQCLAVLKLATPISVSSTTQVTFYTGDVAFVL